MRTDDLIASLTDDLRATPRGAARTRLWLGAAAGAAFASVALIVVLGPRPDLAQAVASSSFWMKAGYTGALAVLALALLSRVSRPGVGGGAVWVGVALAPLLIFTLAGMEMMAAPPAARHGMMMGHSWMLCPWRILGFSLPVFVGLIWAMRRLAPTRLRVAGFAVGLASGAVGATVYGLACTEHTVAFLAIWYSLGILAAGAIGAALGPRLLRW